MKIHSFIIVCLLLPGFNNQKKIDCSKFRNGKFICYDRNNNNEIYSVERNDSIQAVIWEGSKFLTKEKIIWSAECNYKLTHLTTESIDTLPNGRKIIQDYEGPAEKEFKIVNVSEDYYVFETRRLKNKVLSRHHVGFKIAE